MRQAWCRLHDCPGRPDEPYTDCPSRAKTTGPFVGMCSTRLSKPHLMFIGQMLLGMRAKLDMKLSSIARALNEYVLAKKTEECLSRHLDAPGMAQAATGPGY